MVRVVAACSSCRAFTGETSIFDVAALSVRGLIDELDGRYPGFGDHIQRKMAIAIDGAIHQDALFTRLSPDSEVYLIPRIGGG
jgi:molybdopterin converting factor small subunit